jgi:transcriptional regulator with XRE-family HTH domain
MFANLKFAIAVRGLHQTDLAAEVGLFPNVLSEILHGRRKADPQIRARLAKALRTEEAWLFTEDVRIPEPTLRTKFLRPTNHGCELS